MFLRFALLALPIALILLAPLSVAANKEPKVEDLSLRLEGNQVLLDFALRDAFDENLQKRIESGIPSGFTFFFELIRDRKSWFDKGLQSSRLRVDAMYNAVTREYLINFKHDGQLIESRVVRDLDELRSALSDYTAFPVFEVSDRDMGQRLRVRVRALLGTHHVFFFIPRNVTTDWAETRRFQVVLPGDGGEP